jgi:hypothetical protein
MFSTLALIRQRLAALRAAVDELAVAANTALDTNWQTVLEWSEQDRYRIKTETEARKLVLAVTDVTNGVLSWIKGHW